MVEQTLLTPVVVGNKTISLAEMYLQNNEWREKWENKPQFKGLQFGPNANRKSFTRAQDSILGIMYANVSKENLTVSQKDKKIAIISIDMTSENELFAKYFTEALAKKVSDFYVTTKSKKARMNMAILEKQTDSIRRELNGAITGVRYTEVVGRAALEPNEMRFFQEIVSVKADEIVSKWIDFFVLHKSITPERITRRLK